MKVRADGEVVLFDLFSGGGGIDAAVELLRRSGRKIRVGWAANHWPEAVDFHRLRHPDTPVVCQDLCQFDWRRTPGRPDIIWASFACQGNSEAAQPARSTNTELATAHDHLRSTAWAVVSAVLAKQPKAFVAENVPEVCEWSPPPVVLDTARTKAAAERIAMAEARRTGWTVKVRKLKVGGYEILRVFDKGVLWRHWLRTFALSGYHVTTQVVNCARFEVDGHGVPQRRKRMIIVGHLDGDVRIVEPERSEPTLESVLDFDDGEWISIDDIRQDGARERVELADQRFNGEPCWGYHVSHPAAHGRSLKMPSTTVTTQNHHWSVRRRGYRLWTVRETEQVMGFEPGYFDGVPRTRALIMAGNAFPPPAGAAVIDQVIASL